MDRRATREGDTRRDTTGWQPHRATDANRIYRNISDADMTALIAYLRSLKPQAFAGELLGSIYLIISPSFPRRREFISRSHEQAPYGFPRTRERRVCFAKIHPGRPHAKTYCKLVCIG